MIFYVALVQQPLVCCLMLIYYSFNRRFQPFLNDLVLPAMSSLTTTIVLVTLPYLTSVLNVT